MSENLLYIPRNIKILLDL